MAEFKGTKGNWEYRSQSVESNGYYIETVNKSHTNTFIGEVGGGLQCSDEIFSNAKLIAAAPDLLNACLKVIKGGYGCGPSVEYMDSLKKECELAIKKATE